VFFRSIFAKLVLEPTGICPGTDQIIRSNAPLLDPFRAGSAVFKKITWSCHAWADMLPIPSTPPPLSSISASLSLVLSSSSSSRPISTFSPESKTMKNRSHRDRKETTAEPDLENGRGKQPRSHEEKRAKDLRSKCGRKIGARTSLWAANWLCLISCSRSPSPSSASFPSLLPAASSSLSISRCRLCSQKRGNKGRKRGGQRKGR
jgi:hypothetical protein